MQGVGVTWNDPWASLHSLLSMAGVTYLTGELGELFWNQPGRGYHSFQAVL